MNVRDEIALDLGRAIIAGHEGRSAADTSEAKALKAYGLLRDCIRSGQVPDDAVPSILEKDPAFAAWYRGQSPVAPKPAAPKPAKKPAPKT